jgi:hypothetical protein
VKYCSYFGLERSTFCNISIWKGHLFGDFWLDQMTFGLYFGDKR